MLKLVWVPKHLKNFKAREFYEELQEKQQRLDELLAETKVQAEFNRRLYADLLIAQNKLANLPEEEAARNTKIMVEFMTKHFDL